MTWELWYLALTVPTLIGLIIDHQHEKRVRKLERDHFENVVLPNRIEAELTRHENRSANWKD